MQETGKNPDGLIVILATGGKPLPQVIWRSTQDISI